MSRLCGLRWIPARVWISRATRRKSRSSNSNSRVSRAGWRPSRSAMSAIGRGPEQRRAGCRRRARRGKAEGGHGVDEPPGLALQRGGREPGVLDQRRIVLGAFVHLGDRLVDLPDAGRLVLGGGADLRDQPRDLLHAADDLADRTPGFADQAAAVADGAYRGFDQFLDLACRAGRTLRTRAQRAQHCGSLRRSRATSEKPRPWSSARAASTAALSARMLVWKAMPSMTAMMSTIRREAASMSAMVSTTRAVSSPPWLAA